MGTGKGHGDVGLTVVARRAGVRRSRRIAAHSRRSNVQPLLSNAQAGEIRGIVRAAGRPCGRTARLEVAVLAVAAHSAGAPSPPPSPSRAPSRAPLRSVDMMSYSTEKAGLLLRHARQRQVWCCHRHQPRRRSRAAQIVDWVQRSTGTLRSRGCLTSRCFVSRTSTTPHGWIRGKAQSLHPASTTDCFTAAHACIVAQRAPTGRSRTSVPLAFRAFSATLAR